MEEEEEEDKGRGFGLEGAAESGGRMRNTLRSGRVNGCALKRQVRRKWLSGKLTD